MPAKSKSRTRRTSAKDLPTKQKGLSKTAQKKIKGGYKGGVRVAAGDVNGDNLISGGETGINPNLRSN